MIDAACDPTSETLNALERDFSAQLAPRLRRVVQNGGAPWGPDDEALVRLAARIVGERQQHAAAGTPEGDAAKNFLMTLLRARRQGVPPLAALGAHGVAPALLAMLGAVAC